MQLGRRSLTLIAALAIALTPAHWDYGVAALPASEEVPAAECKIALLSNVVFGTYDPVSPTPTDTVGQLGVKCVGATIVTIKLGPGNGGSFWPRSMISGADTLAYNLYADAARTIVWGDGTSSTAFVSWGPPGGEGYQVWSIYGRIPAREDVVSGAYADKLTITVDF